MSLHAAADAVRQKAFLSQNADVLYCPATQRPVPIGEGQHVCLHIEPRAGGTAEDGVGTPI